MIGHGYTVLVIVVKVEIDFTQHSLVALTALIPVARYVVLRETESNLSLEFPIARTHDISLHVAGNIMRHYRIFNLYYRSIYLCLIGNRLCTAQFILSHDDTPGRVPIDIHHHAVYHCFALAVKLQRLTTGGIPVSGIGSKSLFKHITIEDRGGINLA